MLVIADMMRLRDGQGVVNVLAAERLWNSPKLTPSFPLWLLSELFEHLPDFGYPVNPTFYIFFY
jgi:DNA helicase HerA-like ATPase